MKCSKCGNEIKKDQEFCTKCGNKIESNNEAFEDKKSNNILNNLFKKLNKSHKSILISVLVLLVVIIGFRYKQVKLEREVDEYVKRVESSDFSDYVKLNTDDFHTAIQNKETIWQLEAIIRYNKEDISQRTLRISSIETEKSKFKPNSETYNELNNQVEYLKIRNKTIEFAIEMDEAIKENYILAYKKKISQKQLEKHKEKALEEYDVKCDSLENEIKTKGLKYLEIQSIKTSDITSGIYRDSSNDYPQNTSATSINFKLLTIYRMEVKETLNDIECPDIVYTYEISGPQIGTMKGEYAYSTLDNLLSSIRWIGAKYSCLKNFNLYEHLEKDLEKNSTQTNNDNNESNITGIEQAVKDGKLEEDYITKGVSKGELEFEFKHSTHLMDYYDTWEECLEDAQKLNIITSNQSLEEYYKEIGFLEDENEEQSQKITGIEQAVKDGMIGEDYITKGVSRGQLEFAFTDGNLQMYYDTWEECLADAEKLNIITSDEEYLTMEEELDRYYNGI